MTRQVIRQKVFIGLSGGVDSSVSAALLKKQGYEVTGVFIRVWHEDADARGYGRGLTLMNAEGGCQAADDRLDAMRVCAKLQIPFFELNLEKEYKKEVVDYMIREYKAGKTPNPDVSCNRFIKFGGFYKWARKNGADFIATGHYARIGMREAPNHKHQITNKSQITNLKLNTKRYTLNAGLDPQKDQSYFLWQLRKEQLPHILFPVGGMKKPQVRKLAKKFGLITADKKDSQGLCFVGKVNMKEFLAHYIKPKKGKVLDERGRVIGEHDGAFFHTIGERLGDSPRLNLESGKRFNLGELRPLYVISKDIKRNTLTVSHKNSSGGLPHARTEVTIKNCNWISGAPLVGKTYSARVRYRQSLQRCRLANTYGRRYLLNFEMPQIAAPGQSVVLYDRDVCLGGGIIAD